MEVHIKKNRDGSFAGITYNMNVGGKFVYENLSSKIQMLLTLKTIYGFILYKKRTFRFINSNNAITPKVQTVAPRSHPIYSYNSCETIIIFPRIL